MFQIKRVEKIGTHTFCSIIVLENRTVHEIVSKMLYSLAGRRRQYGACALHSGQLRQQINIQNMEDLLFFHCNNGCTNAPQCYVILYTACPFLTARSM